MKVIGLIGGIASGKSAVAAELAALGATVLDADQAAHQVLNLPQVIQTLTDRWGNGILLASGEVDRSEVAGRVFLGTEESAEELKFLEKTLHPVIREQFMVELTQLEAAGTEVVVIDAPLLLEAGWGGLCEAMIFVDSPLEDRMLRGKARNWTQEQFIRREEAQMPIELKRQQATHVVVNNQTLEELKKAVQEVWEALFPG